ncbi:hypothetical protein [Frankia sp. CiP3]|uniref:hypothetical protein n=1 Tax=Frankia sp. CiP3 TaxID=2880971 RepID=UPI001EF678D8|nr:hypothetical protein [Frankia sp. CiP3]
MPAAHSTASAQVTGPSRLLAPHRHSDEDVLTINEAADGWFALLTNLTPDQADAGEVLARYKSQETVERRYSALKGPLGVAPVFLQNPKRIHGLLHLLCLALLVYALIERDEPAPVGRSRASTSAAPPCRPPC